MAKAPILSDLPAEFNLTTAQFTPVSLGYSRADVWQIQWPDGEAYLKAQAVGFTESLARDAEILRWFSTYTRVPEVLAYHQDQHKEYLLMSALPGRPMSDESFQSDSDHMIREVVKALRQIHAIPIELCPFDASLNVKLAEAEQRMQAGEIDVDDCEPEYQGVPAEVLYQRLLDTRPATEDRVVTHGDACLPNFLIDAQGFSGMIDLGRAGIADRWQDLALLIRTLRHNGFSQAEQAFALECYGIEWNPAKYDYYVLLDEFF